MKRWKKDYAAMQEQMIYGESPAYEYMLLGIKEFISRINALDWVMRGGF